MADIELPVPVTKGPYWRVNLRPGTYEENRITNLSRCFDIVDNTEVHFRGRNYPYLSHRLEERGQGSNWVESWTDFMWHQEYWRLYQSGQFLHLFTIYESSNVEWHEELRRMTKSHLGQWHSLDWDNVPGFIHITNFLYTVTEIFEFASRLAQAQILDGEVGIDIGLHGVRDFLLTTDQNRAWTTFAKLAQSEINHRWSLPADTLIGKTTEHSLQAAVWFFERFGWMNPPKQY